MAGLLLSHTGSWVDASHFEGTITLDPTTAIHPAIVGVELAYGDPTGMSISVSGMAFYPASASGPLVAGTRYFATGDGSNTVTYVVVAPAATTLVMSGSRPLSMSSTRETCPRAAVGRSAYRSVQ